MAAKMKKAKAAHDAKARRADVPALPDSWWVWLVVLAVLSSVCLIHVNARLELVRLGYSLSAEAKENHKLVAKRRKLALEVATLRSPRRLRRLAIDNLGMIEPGPSRTIKMKKKSSGKLALNN